MLNIEEKMRRLK